ncbi:acetyltransferase [Neobacillus muris]|uniref:acetyltransferase n=1 Tax=Neobacillus muris TaxID=2941334 RepID=UPI0020414AF9|nr:acetyltransferase [Neobacillus muris]
MKEQVVIVGNGGHAKVIIDLLNSSSQFEIIGCTSSSSKGTYTAGVPIIGDDTILPQLFDQGIKHAFIAIGDNQIRKKLFEKLKQLHFEFVNAISPFSYIAPSVSLGTGIAVMPGAVINTDSKIKDNVIINTGSTIDHDNVIEEHAHIAPGSHLAGHVTVGEGAFIGTGTKIIPEITIGQWSIAGAGSVIIRNVESHTKVAGVPAKKI